MAITEVEAIPVTMGVKPRDEPFGLAPYRSNHDTVESVDRMLVRIATDDGITGWGETLVMMQSPEATAAIIDHVVAPELVGRELTEIQSFTDAFYFPYTRIHPFIGAVETAMWDALGKTRGVSIADFFGGRTVDAVPVAFCLGILDAAAAREHAAFAHDAGFEVVKTKAGPDWREDVDRLTAMHDAVNGELDFRLDPNQGWTFEDAVRATAALEDAGIYLQYLEQPMRIDTYGAYAKLRSRTRTPIAVNEDTYFERNLSHLLKEDAVDVGVVDLVPGGGILKTKGIASMAAEAGLALSHHCGFDLGIKTAAMLHTVATTPAINLAPDTVYYAWDDHIIEGPLSVENGAMPVPEGPGLGVTVDETKLDRYRTDE